MIEITFGKMYIPENERFIGFAGDNLRSTKTFLLKNFAEENCVYRLYLTFGEDATNYFVLDSKVENGSTYLEWNITENQILKSGLVKAQIKAFCEDEVIFHTDYDYFFVAPTLEVDEFSEKEITEFLEYEKRLNEILSKITSNENNFVPSTRNIAGLSLSNDITTELLCDSMKVYPILRLSSAPTKTTEGKSGQLALERSTTNGTTFVSRLYICVSVNSKGEYIWVNILPENSLNGNSISNLLINNNGELEVSLSNGETINLGRIIGADGKDGINGKDGYSPRISVSETETGYDFTIEHSENFVENISINHGVDGENGADGQDGKTPVLGVDYFTESDKANIVSSVIDSLGGNPVFGVVDENNNIVVSGNLPDGTYTVKYELEDGTTVSIGDLVLTEDNPDSGDSGEEIPTYTNLAQPNTDNTTDFTIWCNNARMSGDGSVTARDGYTVTNYVALSNGDTFRVKGFKIERVGLFSANKTALPSGVGNLANLQTNQYVEGGYSQTDEETTFTAKNSNIAYARLSGWVNNTVDDVIITKNEEIV